MWTIIDSGWTVPGCGYLGGRLYVIGGAWRQGPWSVTAWSDQVFVYDPDDERLSPAL